MLTEAELRVLASLKGKSTVSELAEELERSLSYVSELVNRMETKGLVTTASSGKTKRIRRSDARAIELFVDFVQRYTHIPFPKLLSGSTLRVLYWLDSPTSATTLAERADVHRSTVYRSLSSLRNRGLVYQADGKYVLNDEFEGLSTLAQEFGHQQHRTRIEYHVDSYTILWESLDECLIQTGQEIAADSFLLTGPERFQEYDLPLLARQRRYYLYSETRKELSPAELCCHMLVIDDGARPQSYCLLLLSAVTVNQEVLLASAEYYGVEETVQNLLEYLDTDGEQRREPLPPWREFRKLADDYEVVV